jgi:ectoine hydroxylase-related dioxygenase (phytanoyl-CoA dioxygenase family)
MTEPPRSYGITQNAAPPTNADAALALALEEIDRIGFTLLGDMLAPPLVARLRDALDRILSAQIARFGGEAALAEIGDTATARALLEEDDIFLELLRLPRLEAIVEALLGPAALVMQQNGIVMPGGAADHAQQSWHRDLPYQSWVATKPLALGALLALDPFTAESGATWFLPGSHRHERFPSAEFVARWQTQALAPAGSIVVFDAMTFHCGGVNRGSAPRRAVNTVFAIPLLSQQVAFIAKPGMDVGLRRRLGLDYQPARSTDDWRERRRARLRGDAT